MPGDEEQDEETLRVAGEIARYLQRRKKIAEVETVADTLEGISQWWLLRQRLYEEQQRVEKAIRYLCQQGLVEERLQADGRTIYISRSSPQSDTE